MAWADRAILIIGLIWALFVFVMMGGATRTDITLGTYLGIFVIFWGSPILFVWLVLRLAMGNKGAL